MKISNQYSVDYNVFRLAQVPLSKVSLTLLESKFHPEIGARTQIKRVRLKLPEDFFRGIYKVVTVIAPTGFGKTTLLAQWLTEIEERREKPKTLTAWLTFDEHDNDPNRLVRYVIGALKIGVPGLDIENEATTDAIGDTQPEVMLERLSIALLSLNVRVVLFLDDAHQISSMSAIQVLEWLLRQTSSNFRIIAGSRQALGVSIADLRLRGQLLEFDQGSLAFDQDESRDFCELRLRHPIDVASLGALLDKTEGWPAAIELLGLAINDSQDAGKLIADFSTTERGVFEYLSEVVFSRLPGDTLKDIHQLALFDRFCAELIDAACNHPTPNLLLTELNRRHLFLIPLDRQGRWFRFHHLVGDYLRRHAPLDEPTITSTLVAGGCWFYDNGMIDDAISCVVRARNWDLACEWLVNSVEDVAQRRGAGFNLVRWFSYIPHEYLERFPQIRLNYVFSLIFQRMDSEAESELQQLEGLIQNRSHALKRMTRELFEELSSAVPAQRIMLDAVRDNALDLLPRVEAWLSATPNARTRYRGDLLNVAVFACKSLSEIDKGLAYSKEARQVQSADNSLYGLSWNFLLHSLLLFKRGLFAEAKAKIEEGLQFLNENQLSYLEHAAFLQASLSAICYEFDDIPAATQSLELSLLGSLDRTGPADMVILKYVSMARLQFQAGQSEAGLGALRLGRKPGQKRHLSRLTITLAAEECVWLSRLGKHQEAIELAGQFGFDRSIYAKFDVMAEKATRISTRLMLRDQPELAVAHLGPPLIMATEKGLYHRRVELLILQASALLRCGRAHEAMDSWNTALELGQKYGYRRVFLDDMEIIRPLCDTARTYKHVQVPAWLIAQPSKSTVRAEDQLTRKELRILKLLESDLLNKEIADSLFISEGTLKWHLNNIYRKLECKSRSGAVSLARRKGLI